MSTFPLLTPLKAFTVNNLTEEYLSVILHHFNSFLKVLANSFKSIELLGFILLRM